MQLGQHVKADFPMGELLGQLTSAKHRKRSHFCIPSSTLILALFFRPPKADASPSPLSSAAGVHGSLAGVAKAPVTWSRYSFNHDLDVQPSVRPGKKTEFCSQWDRLFKLRPLL